MQYNNAGYLVKVISYENDDYPTTYTTEFVYANNRLTEINLIDVEPTGSDIYKYTCEYNASNQLIKIKEVGSDDYVLRAYNNSGQLIKEESYYEGDLDYYDTFEWSGNNVIVENWYSPEDDGGRKIFRPLIKFKRHSLFSARVLEDVQDAKLEMKYDDKVNPIRFSNLTSFDVEGSTMSKNNVVEVKYTYYLGNAIDEVFSEQYAYTYNDEGLPIRIEISETGDDADDEVFVINVEYL